MLVYETEDIEVTTQIPTTTSTTTTEPTSIVQYNSDIGNWYDSAPIATTGDGTVDALNSIASELHMIRILIVFFAIVFFVWRTVNVVKRALVKLADF
jgi:hypothetical protein